MKERIKTTSIILLLLNLIVMTCHLWFGNSFFREDLGKMVMNFPIVRNFTSASYSIPLERLSTPRKFLINDGSLWIAYYNTDAVFAPIEGRTRQIIEGFLRGEILEVRTMTIDEWQRSLESVSIYVEYPIAYTMEMLCSVMGIDSKNVPKDVSVIRDFIIFPSGEENGVLMAVRDAYDEEKVFAYRFEKDKFNLPREDLAIYTRNNSGYYEPAFSTGLETEGVSLDPMVLFSDSQPNTALLTPMNPIETTENQHKVLGSFFNNINTAGSYSDGDGGIIYVENYSDVRIYTNGLFEFKSVTEGKGVRIADEYDSYYETINGAIRFAENLWSSVSDKPLSVLVTSDLTDSNPENIHLTMDYYFDGRPIAINLPGEKRFEQLNHCIEMDIQNGMVVSYRQLFREYASSEARPLEEEFISALDGFVNAFSADRGTVIDDIYIGYMDNGGYMPLSACWLAKIQGDDETYFYDPKEDMP